MYKVKEEIFMNKYAKIFLKVMPVLMVVVLMSTSVFGIQPNLPATGNNSLGKITGLAGSIWNTVATIIQILAIAAIIIAGVRYMFASADTKADIKKQTVILVAGAILVFAAVPIAKFIGDVANNALSQ
jgi:protein-S-isoprenylcysteine O-methyltransferase Ste14